MADSDIQAAGPECLKWTCTDTSLSLEDLLKYVESEAQKSIKWYWRSKGMKAFFSQWIQFLAVVLTSMAAIVPIIGQISKIPIWQNPLWASLLVGIAAALLALDKAFGFSSGWARYVMAATNIRRALEEFRMDWEILSAKSCPQPTPEQIEALLQRAKAFRLAVEGLVLQETKDWVAEFQNNLAQMEKDISSQLTTLKADAEKAQQERATAGQPGSIQLTVPNADKAEGSKIQVKLEDASGVAANESVTGSKTWVHLNSKPGQYRLTATAILNGKTVSTMAVVIVKAGEIATAEVSLPE